MQPKINQPIKKQPINQNRFAQRRILNRKQPLFRRLTEAFIIAIVSKSLGHILSCKTFCILKGKLCAFQMVFFQSLYFMILSFVLCKQKLLYFVKLALFFFTANLCISSNLFLAVPLRREGQLYRWPRHSLTDYYTLLKNTAKEHSETLVTIETCDQSDEET